MKIFGAVKIFGFFQIIVLIVGQKCTDNEVKGQFNMRNFGCNTTWEDVQDMTIEEAIAILSHDANSDGKEWQARPHKAKAAQMAIEALMKIQNEKVWVVYYRNTDEDFGYSFDGTYVFKNEKTAKIVAEILWKHNDYVTIRENNILEDIPENIYI